MQDLSLLVIDEGQQYGTDREIAVISLLKQQPLSCGLGTQSRRHPMPKDLASSWWPKTRTTQRQELLCHHQVLRDGEHALGKLWTSQLSQQAAQDLQKVNTVLPGLDAQFRAAQPNEQAQLLQ